jgi:hypothetical protein
MWGTGLGGSPRAMGVGRVRWMTHLLSPQSSSMDVRNSEAYVRDVGTGVGGTGPAITTAARARARNAENLTLNILKSEEM